MPLYFCIGSKYWKSQKNIKAVSQADYTQYCNSDPEAEPKRYETSDDDFQPSKKRKTAASSIGYTRSLSPFVISSSDDGGSYTPPPSTKGKGTKGKGKMITAEGSDYKSLEERIRNLESKITKVPSAGTLPVTFCTCQKIKDLFKCFVCSCIVNCDYFLLVCCGNLACSSCISQWAENSSTCPLCRQSIDPHIKPPLPRSLVELLQIMEAPTAKDNDPSSSSAQSTVLPTHHDPGQ